MILFFKMMGEIRYGHQVITYPEYINLLPTSYYHTETLRNIFFDLFRNNLIIPLAFANSYTDINDKKGMRLLNYQILSLEQMKSLYNIPGYASEINIPFFKGEASVCDTADDNLNISTHETYKRILNVSYLVDEEGINSFLNGSKSEEQTNNIAKKKVQECSVNELLIAINKKLRKVTKNG